VSGRSPARLLAPAALIATFLALFLVIGAGGGGDGETPVESGGNQPAATKPSSTSKKPSSSEKPSTSSSKRYTVKPGDTPSSIAEEAGIPLERLLELNPDIDPQALSPGQKLKLE
jgi:LysM repeat protein